MIRAYAIFMRLLSVFAPLWLRRRVKAGKEDPARLPERYGRASLARPEGELIWLHGASVGETMMMLPLINRLLAAKETRHVLVTSGTLTSAALMEKNLPERAFHQYVPMDAPHYVKRFLTHWRPDLAVWAESEIWPNLVRLTHASKTPMALINARLSDKSLASWKKRGSFATHIFTSFNTLLPADTRTAKGLSDITRRDLKPVGNLKYDVPPLTYDKSEYDTLKHAIETRKIWVAASIHAEEIDVILSAHHQIKDSLLILVPRHPSDAANRMIFADYPSLTIKRRSRGEVPDTQTDIYLCDTFGDMGLAYALGNVAFVGGSLDARLMGHNPLEPIRLGTPTLTGPHYASFSDVYAPLIANNAVLAIEDIDALAQIIREMLNAPDKCEEMSARAAAQIKSLSGSLVLTHETLEALL